MLTRTGASSTARVRFTPETALLVAAIMVEFADTGQRLLDRLGICEVHREAESWSTDLGRRLLGAEIRRG